MLCKALSKILNPSFAKKLNLNMNDQLLKLLAQLDTPTICNAIEVAQGQRGFARFTRSTILSSYNRAPAIFGRARTARICAREAATETAQQVRQLRMDYYRYVAEAAAPAVVVIEDSDYPDCTGAFWGEINSRVHMGLGLQGVLTNGLMRDLGDVPIGFPMLAGGIGPSHAFVRVSAIACPVQVFGLSINPDEFIHADRHGAVVIPEDVLSELPAAIAKLQASEQIILRAAQSPGFNIDKLIAAWQKFEQARV